MFAALELSSPSIIVEGLQRNMLLNNSSGATAWFEGRDGGSGQLLLEGG
jgi:hypothetical protein